MGNGISRRRFAQMTGAALLLPGVAAAKISAGAPRSFRIRTLTAGVAPASLADVGVIDEAARFLKAAKTRFEAAGYEVQTLRVATTPLPRYAAAGVRAAELGAFARAAEQNDLILSIGPVLIPGQVRPDFADFASGLTASVVMSPD